MELSKAAAFGYALVSAGVVAFQLALAAGAPWGRYAMGGAFPDRYPPAMRVAAVVQAGILTAMAVVVLARVGWVLPDEPTWARSGVWVVVAFSGVGLVLNLATPSAAERRVWAPVALAMLLSSVGVAVARP